jgi:hypothetical protein
MSVLVEVPGHPGFFLTPSTLHYYQLLCAEMRTNLGFSSTVACWRSYASQAALYADYLRGGSPASNPDNGQRNHMRGAAFDLLSVTAAVRTAAVRVGLAPDTLSGELWHWNDPNWRNMPIIPTNTVTAGMTSTLIPDILKEQDMTDLFFVRRIADGAPVVNGMECIMGPGFFTALGSGDLAGITRDLKIPAEKIIDGTPTGTNGLPAIEFQRLIAAFHIPSGYVKAGGIYPPVV